ncbi:hypothetical protein [Inediibacterium massiliense]|uniref:hypothetical protein n=1 Tax=Inediibacterium massiliense TaxID=1658111 RepID=UPI0006B44BE3|nr:hypothetical protein [Inediibacterium massiliense]
MNKEIDKKFIVRAYEDKYIPEVLKYYLESEIHMDVQTEVVNKIRKSNEEYNNRLEEAKKIYNEEQKSINKALNLIN